MDPDALELASGCLPDTWLNILRTLLLEAENVKTAASKSSPIKMNTY